MLWVQVPRPASQDAQKVKAFEAKPGAGIEEKIVILRETICGLVILCIVIGAFVMGLNAINSLIDNYEKQERVRRIKLVSELESSTEDVVKIWVRCNINPFYVIIPSDIKHLQYNTNILILEGPPKKIAKLLKKVYGLEVEKSND